MILPERVFGSSGVKTMFAGFAIAPILFATWLRSSSSISTERALVALEDHVGDDRLTGRRIGAAAHGGLGDLRVVDERRLDLDRREAVTRDVHHVVDATEQPEIAVRVEPGAVAREVVALEPLSSTSRGSARRRRRCRASSPARVSRAQVAATVVTRSPFSFSIAASTPGNGASLSPASSSSPRVAA